MIKVFLALAAGLAAVAIVGSALAVSSLSLDDKATLSDSKTSVTATGTIVCPVGFFATVNVTVVQSSGQADTHGFGSDDFTCSGQVQTWSVVVNVFIGEAYKSGPAIGLFSASSCTGDPSIPPDDEDDPVVCTAFPASVQGIKIQK
jgi:hypothetical protein